MLEKLTHIFSNWGKAVDMQCCELANGLIMFALICLVFVIVSYIDKKSYIIRFLARHLVLSAVIVWLVGFVVYMIGFWGTKAIGLPVVLRAIISSFKMFVVTNELARVDSDLQNDSQYMLLFSVTHFCAAYLAFVFILKMIGFKAQSALKLFFLRLTCLKKKKVHLFWGVNTASCVLAKDIRENYDKKAIIIFVDIDDDNSDDTQKKATLGRIFNAITISDVEIALLMEIGAYVDHCYNGPAQFSRVDKLNILRLLRLRSIRKVVKRANSVNMYFLSEDEVNNINGALNFQRDTTLTQKPTDKVTMYVHARKDSSNEIFDHYSQYDEKSSKIDIKIIDSAYLSVAQLKEKPSTLPVSCVNVAKNGCVDAPFTSLIVGFGQTGLEAFKFLYEFSTFIGSDKKRTPFRCYAIDANMDSIEGYLRAKMPGISNEELCLISTNVDTALYWEYIAKLINELNYVVVALNNDRSGLAVAINIFKYALQHRDASLPKLEIALRNYGSENRNRINEVIDQLNDSIVGRNIELNVFGGVESLYMSQEILCDATLNEAKEFHRVYEGSSQSADKQWRKDFVKNDETGLTAIDKTIKKVKKDTNIEISRFHAIYDINRRIEQNISNSLHCCTKMILMGIDENESSERLEPYYDSVISRKKNTIVYEKCKVDVELLHNIARVEHERWIASHKLMGYKWAPTNNPIKKFHHDMCPWEELGEEIKSYDCNVVDTTIKLAYQKANKDK